MAEDVCKVKRLNLSLSVALEFSSRHIVCLTTQENKDKIKQNPAPKHPKYEIKKLKY